MSIASKKGENEYTFGKRAHQSTQVIGLFQFPLTDFDDIGKILLNLAQKFASYRPFSEEQAVHRVLVISGLFHKCVECLRKPILVNERLEIMQRA